MFSTNFLSFILPFASASIQDLLDQAANINGTFRNFNNAGALLLPTLTNNIIDQIGDYGCWCYFLSNGGKVGVGLGQPVDETDLHCKILHDNYHCMTFDDSTCDPWNAVYNVPPTWGGTLASLTTTDDDIRATCTSLNSDSCAQNACIENFEKNEGKKCNFL